MYRNSGNEQSSQLKLENKNYFDEVPNDILKLIVLYLDAPGASSFRHTCRGFANNECIIEHLLRLALSKLQFAPVQNHPYDLEFLTLSNDGKVLEWEDQADNQPQPRHLPNNANTRIDSISFGRHLFEIDSRGLVYDNWRETQPITHLVGKRIIAMAQGSEHSLVLDANGCVYAYGLNFDGQLGVGDDEDCYSSFQLVTALNGERIIAIAAESDSSLALSAEGKVYFWGEDCRSTNFTEIVHRGYSQFMPRLVTGLIGKRIIAIDEGCSGVGTHYLALDELGLVYAWGDNCHGQLGLGHNNREDNPKLVTVLNGRKITAIAAGGFVSLALDMNGQVYFWGA